MAGSRQRLLALSIDLDALDLYLGLYGMGEPLSERAAQAVPAVATERFCDLCDALGVHGTLFVVGRDLALGRGHDQIRRAAREGHEIGSHSFAHDYALSRRSAQDIDDDLARAEREIEAVIDGRVAGFRAPGYTLSPTLQDCLAKRGYAYDSSLLPSPPYYAAKAAVIGALALVGRRSHSILGPIGQLLRPRVPHVDSHGVLELPVSVLPGMRAPFIGTLITTTPAAVTTTLARQLRADELVVIELHGIDLLDGSDGVPPELTHRQRDLQVPATLKRQRIETVLRDLLSERQPVTLLQSARLVSGRTAA